MKKLSTSRLFFPLVVLATFSRLIPHAPNFTPVTAVCFVAGMYLPNRWLKLALPLLSIWLSDLVLNNWIYAQKGQSFSWIYEGWISLYGAWILVALIGSSLSGKDSLGIRYSGILLAGLVFFIVSNLGCWPNNPLYSQDLQGLMNCLASGVPFYWNSLAADLLYFSLFSALAEGIIWYQKEYAIA